MITDAALVAGGLWVIGFILTKVPYFPNGLIPVFLILIGAPAQMQALNGDWENIVHWLAALALAAAATGLNEAITQTKDQFTKIKPKD